MGDTIIPNKSLGQHWLHDKSTLDSICQSAQVFTGDNVLEIGPGLGTLTERLLHQGASVTAVEFDHNLATKLQQRNWGALPEKAHLDVIESDILRFDFGSMPSGFKVVANIPYYLTSNLIRKLCESTVTFSIASLLVQKEVAERICATPREMSILAVTTQFYCDVSLGVMVPAALFTPPPKVDSQVVVLRYRSQPLFDDVKTDVFFRIVKAGFSQKRKTLANSLAGGLHLEKQAAKDLLNDAKIDVNSRAQDLDLENWHRLYVAYKLRYSSAHE